MVTEVALLTLTVLTVKVAVVLPAGTVTLAGTAATLLLLLLRLTLTPPVGAALVSVTVPVEDCSPVTVDGFSETDCKAADALIAINSEAELLALVAQLIEVVRFVCVAETML